MSLADAPARIAQAYRALRRAPGVSAAAAVALAIGIAANTIVFSIVDAALLRPPPFDEPDALVFVGERSPQSASLPASYPDYLDWRGRNSVFESIAVHDRETFNLTGNGEPAQVNGFNVSASFFDVLRAKAAIGRLITADDDRLSAAPVVVLSHASWMRRFGGDPAIVGRTIVLDRIPRTVVGVLPVGFQYPTAGDRGEIYSPFARAAGGYRDRSLRVLAVIARLKPAVSIAQARADLDTISRQVADAFPSTNRDVGSRIDAYRDRFVASSRVLLASVWGAVSLVLLVACASAASVLVARGAARTGEFGIRVALGATRADLLAQVLTESLLLAVVAGTAGILAALWGLPAVVALMPPDLPHAVDFSFNWRALVVALSSAVATGILGGIAPAWQAGRISSCSTANAAVTRAVARPKLRAALVVGQLAASQALLVGAGLLIATLVHLLRTDTGFDPARVATGNYYLTDSAYVTHDQISGFHQRLVDRLSREAGIAAAGLITPAPFSFGSAVADVVVEGRDTPARATSFRATPGAFGALGIRLEAGRLFDDRDSQDAPAVAVVDDRFARSMFKGASALGRRVRIDRTAQWMEIVGVVGHISARSLDEPAQMEIYMPLFASSFHFTAIVARSAGPDPQASVPAMRRVLHEMDPDLPLFGVAPMAVLVDQTAGRARLAAFVFVAFAAAAWLLAAIGLAGVVGYSVTMRTRELGIRLALGARPAALVRGVVSYGSGLTLAGLGIGIAGGLAGARALSSLLVGVRPLDPTVLGLAALALLATGGLASYFPARRASRVDPLVALKAD
jgi:putative ABC transport system permease protein